MFCCTKRNAAATLGLLVAAVAFAADARAAPIWGIPVTAAGSSTASVMQAPTPLSATGFYGLAHDATPDGVNNATNDWIKYYIPLNGPLATDGTARNTSGVYGVTDTTSGGGACADGVDCAGTFVDVGKGSTSLTMFLMFALDTERPYEDATLKFEFSDLDLNKINDPDGFFETMQIFNKNGTAISPLFTASYGTGTTGTTAGLEWATERSFPDGKNWPFFLTFSGSGLTDLVNCEPTPAACSPLDPFWVKLQFGVPLLTGTWQNTPEYLRASLEVTPAQQVPEPSSLLLTGLSVMAIRAVRRRRP